MFTDLNDNIGFIMPRFTDGISVIWNGKTESFYRFILLLFYLLRCFQVRFYQYKGWRIGRGTDIIRRVSFHLIIWNPISLLAGIIFQVMNHFYGKSLISIDVSPNITIDVKNNKAYILHT